MSCVNGYEVIIRSNPSVSSQRIAELNKNVNVTILVIISRNNSDDPLLIRSEYLNCKGDRITLQLGFAVKIIRKNSSKYICSLEVGKKLIQINM